MPSSKYESDILLPAHSETSVDSSPSPELSSSFYQSPHVNSTGFNECDDAKEKQKIKLTECKVKETECKLKLRLSNMDYKENSSCSMLPSTSEIIAKERIYQVEELHVDGGISENEMCKVHFKV